jgi:hypothetical protein
VHYKLVRELTEALSETYEVDVSKDVLKEIQFQTTYGANLEHNLYVHFHTKPSELRLRVDT